MAWGNYCARHTEAGELREAQRKEVHEARQKLEETAAQAALYEEILRNRGDTICSREELIVRCGRLSAVAISLLGEKRDVRLVMQDRKLWTEHIAAWDKNEAERARRAELQGQGLTKKERKKKTKAKPKDGKPE